MSSIVARNVNEALMLGMLRFRDSEPEFYESGKYKRLVTNSDILEMESRNGTVLKFKSPVLIEYAFPNERVLFDADRNANPFFHFFEGLWMLNGNNDVRFLTYFNKRMHIYSDDNLTLNGAYGYRWKNFFKKDQVAQVITMLTKAPTTRRAVIQMWDCDNDLSSDSLDIPCNTHIYFSINHLKGKDHLDMTVCNRSNDMIWGAFGANAVHFSMLHEYVAAMVGVQLGKYFQFTNNLHVYKDVFDKLNSKFTHNIMADAYDIGQVKPLPLVDKPSHFTTELSSFMYQVSKMTVLDSWSEALLVKGSYYNKVLYEVAGPMYIAWWHWKNRNIKGAIQYAKKIKASDWRKACVEWLERKKD